MNRKNIHPNKLLICSLGSIGKRYLNLIAENWPDIEIGILTSKPLNVTSKMYKVSFVSNNLKDCLDWKPNAAFICNPASLHIDYAISLLNSKVPVLIEKPLGTGSESFLKLNKLQDLSKTNVALLGYVLRHEDEYRYLKRYLKDNNFGRIISGSFICSSWLPNWRKTFDYRDSVSASKNLGGGALLELSHEIDLAQSLLGKINLTKAILEISGKLDISVEDKVLLLGKTQSCKEIIIDLNFCSKDERRLTYLKSKNGIIKWDLNNKFIEIKIANQIKNKVQFNKNPNIKYVNQIKHFFNCIYGIDNPVCKIKDGIMVLDLVNKARELSYSYINEQ